MEDICRKQKREKYVENKMGDICSLKYGRYL